MQKSHAQYDCKRARRPARGTLHKANGTITDLNLDGNKIGDDGARALADGLKATLASCFWTVGHTASAVPQVMLSGFESRFGIHRLAVAG